jgi:hypothetical protein
MLTDYTQFHLSMLADKFTADEMGRITRIQVKGREFPVDRDTLEECFTVLRNFRNHVQPSQDMSDEDLRKLLAQKKNHQAK